MEKLLIYELNEFPIRLLNEYILLKPNSTLAYISKQGLLKQTITSDSGELHPWSTWPTFYRGVDNSQHGLKFINQNKSFADQNYPSVWDILSIKNISIGIFGSLQSYPPPEINENIKFYLPDTFSADEKSFPKELEVFQKFNLSVVSNNNAIARNITLLQIKNFLECLSNRCISFSTLIKIIYQIIREKFSKKYKLRRALIQPIIGFDAYLKYLYKEKPSFSTFFTNHLAGMMHRYWFDYFPEDFEVAPRKKSDFKRNSIIEALNIADSQLKTLLKFAMNNNYNIWIASSMGQDYIQRGNHTKELFLKEPKNLIKILDLDLNNYNFLPSMYPDINIDCQNSLSVKKLIRKINYIFDINKEQILKLRYEPIKNKINLIIKNSDVINKHEYLFIKDKKFKIQELGFETIERDQGTGYHIPEGILLTYGNRSKDLFYNFNTIDTKLIAPIILRYFNLERERYMQEI
tara:strand:+ start:2503 stop:3891 length:1389 start_codon:yes stop_codon:yes gene_type:complete